MVVCSHPQPAASKELQDFLLGRLGLSSNALNLGLRQAELEHKPIPEWLNPQQIPGLRSEAVEVLQQFQPRTFGQASRLAGVNPTDLSLVALAVRRGPSDPSFSEGVPT